MARYYLSNSALELNEAAYLLGFEDPNSFVHNVKKSSGQMLANSPLGGTIKAIEYHTTQCWGREIMSHCWANHHSRIPLLPALFVGLTLTCASGQTNGYAWINNASHPGTNLEPGDLPASAFANTYTLAPCLLLSR
jgi:hypothetical protein